MFYILVFKVYLLIQDITEESSITNYILESVSNMIGVFRLHNPLKSCIIHLTGLGISLKLITVCMTSLMKTSLLRRLQGRPFPMKLHQ